MARSPRAATPTPAPIEAIKPWRGNLVLGLLLVSAVGMVAKAWSWQVSKADDLQRRADARHVRTLTTEAHRGAIIDRNGAALALSAPVDYPYAVPDKVLAATPAQRAQLAAMLQTPVSRIESRLKTADKADRKFVFLTKQPYEPDVARAFTDLKIDGVLLERHYQRYYPAGEVAGQVVGFCGKEGRGLEGMEFAHDATLAGKSGKQRVIKDKRGRIIDDLGVAVASTSGKDLRLTLDLRLQYLAYRELRAAVTRNQAEGGMMVVADVQSGDILAAVALPAYNPNDQKDRKQGLKNRAITDRLEPGSTLKPLTVALGLESGLYSSASLIDTNPGSMQIGKWTIREYNHKNYGVINLATLLEKSSNIASAKMGLRLGRERMRDGLSRFGIGRPVEVGFPGEATGTLRALKDWRESETASAAYGYGVSMSALHLVRAYAALANHGRMPELSLVLRDRLPAPQTVVDAKAADQVLRMMREVITTGTGKAAAVPGYAVAGKTGTVRKLARGGGYTDGSHWSAFVGVLPASKPRLVGLVFVDAPTAGGYTGGAVAAPVFSAVMGGAARLLQIPQDAPYRPAPATQTAGEAATGKDPHA